MSSLFLTGTLSLVSPQQWTAGAVTVWWASGRQVNGVGSLAYWTLSQSWWACKASHRLYKSPGAHSHRMLAKKWKHCAFLEQLLRLNSRCSHLHDFNPCPRNHIHLFSGSQHFLQTSTKKKKKETNKQNHSPHLLAPEFSLFPDGIFQPPNSQLSLENLSALFNTRQVSVCVQFHTIHLMLPLNTTIRYNPPVTLWTVVHNFQTHLQTIWKVLYKRTPRFDFSIPNNHSFCYVGRHCHLIDPNISDM